MFGPESPSPVTTTISFPPSLSPALMVSVVLVQYLRICNSIRQFVPSLARILQLRQKSMQNWLRAILLAAHEPRRSKHGSSYSIEGADKPSCTFSSLVTTLLHRIKIPYAHAELRMALKVELLHHVVRADPRSCRSKQRGRVIKHRRK